MNTKSRLPLDCSLAVPVSLDLKMPEKNSAAERLFVSVFLYFVHKSGRQTAYFSRRKANGKRYATPSLAFSRPMTIRTM